MIQFIVYGKEETNLSEAAKEWFYQLVLNGEKGPFTCQTFNQDTKAIILNAEDQQPSLFTKGD